MALELLNQLSDCFSAIRVLLLDCRMRYAWYPVVDVAAAGIIVTSRCALVVWGFFLLLGQVDPVVHFANLASVQFEASLEIGIPCGTAPPLYSCIPLSQYKSKAVCYRERLRLIVFENIAILSSERALHCTNPLCPWLVQITPISSIFWWSSIGFTAL